MRYDEIKFTRSSYRGNFDKDCDKVAHILSKAGYEVMIILEEGGNSASVFYRQPEDASICFNDVELLKDVL